MLGGDADPDGVAELPSRDRKGKRVARREGFEAGDLAGELLDAGVEIAGGGEVVAEIGGCFFREELLAVAAGLIHGGEVGSIAKWNRP